jgi:A/G-specific adenine glycosylase
VRVTTEKSTEKAASARDRHVVRSLEKWFARHQRPLPWRAACDPYQVWVSEVMLQQTRMEVVLGGYFDAFLSRFPTLLDLAAATEEDVLTAWSGLGYYRRASMLHAGAVAVRERFGSRIPQGVEELTAIPGVGRYTAGAISSIAFNRPAPIVDGNVARILCRLDLIEEPLGSAATTRATWARAGQLVAIASQPRDFNQSLMELGALVCRPANPACHRCPVRTDCRAFAANRTAELPARRKRGTARELRIRLFLVTDNRGRVLLQRESGGSLMKSMYHLPHGDGSLLPGCSTDLDAQQVVGTFRHTVTNRRITFELCTARGGRLMRDSTAEFAWVHPAELGDVPHPSYVTKALQLAGVL